MTEGLLLLIFTLFLAGKDATSFLLKDKNTADALDFKRIKRWHRDGVALAALFTGVLAYYSHQYWQVPITSLLIRLAVFDIAFNKWAGLSVTYLGSTALFDKIFIKIFGKHGAFKKSIFFVIATIIWVILNKNL